MPDYDPDGMRKSNRRQLLQASFVFVLVVSFLLVVYAVTQFG